MSDGLVAARRRCEYSLTLLGQEARDVADKTLRVLVLRTVVGVRVDYQLRVGDVLLQNPGVDGVDDHVVVAVDYQSRLQDGLEVLVRTLTLHAPLADCLDLSGCHLLVHLGIAVLSAAEENASGTRARRPGWVP